MTARSKEYIKVPTSDIESLGDGFSLGGANGLGGGGNASSDASALSGSASGSSGPNGKSGSAAGEGYSPAYQVRLRFTAIYLIMGGVLVFSD